MATRAYILVRTEVGKTADIAAALKEVEGVQSVDVVSGPYDIITTVEADDASAVGPLVLKKMHGLEGLSSTLTCVVIG